MDRTHYLELCQKNAVFKNVIVNYNSVPYYPIKFEMAFDAKVEEFENEITQIS